MGVMLDKLHTIFRQTSYICLIRGDSELAHAESCRISGYVDEIVVYGLPVALCSQFYGSSSSICNEPFCVETRERRSDLSLRDDGERLDQSVVCLLVEFYPSGPPGVKEQSHLVGRV